MSARRILGATAHSRARRVARAPSGHQARSSEQPRERRRRPARRARGTYQQYGDSMRRSQRAARAEYYMESLRIRVYVHWARPIRPTIASSMHAPCSIASCGGGGAAHWNLSEWRISPCTCMVSSQTAEVWADIEYCAAVSMCWPDQYIGLGSTV